METQVLREAVGVFDSIRDLNEAVAELEITAFPRQDISVLADDPKHFSHYVGASALEDNPDAPRSVLIRQEEESIGIGVMIGGGMYAGAVTGLLAGGISSSAYLFAIGGAIFGAALGALVSWMLGRYYESILNRQIQQGGVLLWVRAADMRAQHLACTIMSKHNARRVHVHELTH